MVDLLFPVLTVVSGVFVFLPLLFYVAPFALLFLFLSTPAAQPAFELRATILKAPILKATIRAPVKATETTQLREAKKASVPIFGDLLANPSPLLTIHDLRFTVGFVLSSLPQMFFLREVHERAPPCEAVV